MRNSTTLNHPFERTQSMSPFSQHTFTVLISSRFQPGEPYGAHRSPLRNAQDRAPRSSLGPESRVLRLGTDGASDPDLYQRLVGRSSAQVLPDRGVA
jgi:hypothetical protein